MLESKKIQGTTDKIRSLLKACQNGHAEKFGQLLSVIEKAGAESLKSTDLISPSQYSFRIGITGPPGAGKSTLIRALIEELRKIGMSVGVLAVDPSSPFSQGAILGDRIRYNEFYDDPQVFVRSIGSRGSSGGIAALSYLMLRAYDAFGFDVTIIETVGVGQTELEIMNVADIVSVVLVPESGDSIQTMKAGLLEIADLFVINKSDRPGAEALANELKNSLNLDPTKQASSIFLTAAIQNQGTHEWTEFMLSLRDKIDLKKNRHSTSRLKAEARTLLKMEIEKIVDQKVSKIKSVRDLAKLF